jgi:hypothetical protein
MPPVGPNGQPNPRNVYAATDEESTPEGAAAALARRQTQRPVGAGIGQGAESLLQPVFHPIDTVENLVKQSIPGFQLSDSLKKAYPVIQAYEKARAEGKSIWESLSAANNHAGKQDASAQVVEQAIADYKKNPTLATAKMLTQAAGTVAMLAAGGQSATMEEAPEVAALRTANAERQAAFGPSHVFNPTTGEVEPITQPSPGLVKQVIKGKNVNQPGAQAAVRSGVRASTEATGTADESLAANIKNQPLVKGPTTVLDKHMSALQDNETAAYKKMDDTAGFDVKAEKQQLANDQYKLKQLGNTDADVTARGNLVESINDSTDRVAQAEAKMKAAGVDPKAADAIHQQRMSGLDFKKSLIKNTNPADGSVNVDGLLNDAKKLRFTKYGDRLEQFMGKEGADNYVSQLEEMQKLGAHAVKARWVAGILAGLSLGGGTVAKVAHIGAALVP